MSTEIIERHFRIFLYALAVFIFCGTLVELRLERHTGSRIELIPFVLSALGIVIVTVAYFKPTQMTLLGLRVVMLGIVAGSVYGVYHHFNHNRHNELDLHPETSGIDLLKASLTGASPMLAPGILALAAVLAIAATYYHPALKKRSG